MIKFTRNLLAATWILSSVGGSAFPQTFPSIDSTGVGQDQVPVTAYQAPANIPAGETPTPTGPAVGVISAVQSYAVSQNTPTSPQPTCTEPPDSSQYQLNQYQWPTAAQSIAWWESQPGIPAPGTFAYTIGATYSHQDAEGWAGGCTADPEPACPEAGQPGWLSYTWGGQYTGWTGSCTYVPKPACPASGSPTGWVSTYEWNGSAWVGACNYIAPPVCPAGYNDSYVWNSTSNQWQGACTQPPQPGCPAGYNGSYVWNSAGYWQDACYQPPKPSCPPGYDGSYVWSNGWVSACYQPARPSCPAGYNNDYSWGGASGWVGSCQPAVSTCYITDSYEMTSAYAIDCGFLSYFVSQESYLHLNFVETVVNGDTFVDLAGSAHEYASGGRSGMVNNGVGADGYTTSVTIPGGTASYPVANVESNDYGGVSAVGALDDAGSAEVPSIEINDPGHSGHGKNTQACYAGVVITDGSTVDTNSICTPSG